MDLTRLILLIFVAKACSADDLCGVCPYGHGQIQPCNEAAGLKRRCERCDPGYFVEGMSKMKCQRCKTRCPVGSITERDCSLYHDRICKSILSNQQGNGMEVVTAAGATTPNKKLKNPVLQHIKWIASPDVYTNRPVPPVPATPPRPTVPRPTKANNGPTDPSDGGTNTYGPVAFYVILAVVATLAVVGVSLMLYCCFKRKRKTKKDTGGNNAAVQGSDEPLFPDNDIPPPGYEKCDEQVESPPTYTEAIAMTVQDSSSQQTHRVNEKKLVTDDEFHSACSQHNSSCDGRQAPTAPPCGSNYGDEIV